MKQLNIFLITSFILSFIFFSHSISKAATTVENLEKRTSLAGTWKIEYEDKLEFAQKNFNDTSWQEITMPGSIMKTPYFILKNLSGIAWLRKNIIIDKNVKGKNIGLILGRIAQADEVYFNGHLIGKKGSFPPDEFSMWNFPRHYLIPESYIEYGKENVIAVRISYNLYGEIRGEIALTNMVDWEKDRDSKNFWYITIIHILIGVGHPFTIIFFIFFLFRRDQEYLFFVIQNLFSLVIMLDFCTHLDIYGSQEWRFKIIGLAWLGLNWAHPCLLHRLYHLNRKKIEKALLAFVILSIIIILTMQDRGSGNWKSLFITFGLTCIGVYNISCHITALIKKRRFAYLLSFLGMASILGAIHDAIVSFTKYSGIQLHVGPISFENNIFAYTGGFFLTGTALILVYRFITVMNEVEDLNLNLERKVLERTDELSQAKDEIEAVNEELEAMNENLMETNEDLEKSERRHEADLWMAANVQKAFLPQELPVSEKYDIALVFNAISNVSGDFYDFYYKDGILVGAGVFDVSGHGISSALITLLARSTISRIFTNSYNKPFKKVIEDINQELIKEIGDLDSYITCVLLRFQENIVEYVNSGHPDLIIKSAKFNTALKILDKEKNSINGPFLGVPLMSKKPFKSLSFELQKDDCLLLYSDALNETTNAHKEGFGIKRIIDALQKTPIGPAENMLNSVLDEFFQFIGSKNMLSDDLTVMLIKKK